MVITEHIIVVCSLPLTSLLQAPASSQSYEERGSDVMSDPTSTWTSPEVVLPQLLEKSVMLVQPLLVYAWEHIKKTNQFLSNFQSNRFLL